jgi:hypothetical protein
VAFVSAQWRVASLHPMVAHVNAKLMGKAKTQAKALARSAGGDMAVLPSPKKDNMAVKLGAMLCVYGC